MPIKKTIKRRHVSTSIPIFLINFKFYDYRYTHDVRYLRENFIKYRPEKINIPKIVNDLPSNFPSLETSVHFFRILFTIRSTSNVDSNPIENSNSAIDQRREPNFIPIKIEEIQSILPRDNLEID